MAVTSLATSGRAKSSNVKFGGIVGIGLIARPKLEFTL
jgi:hypothetical protein